MLSISCKHPSALRRRGDWGVNHMARLKVFTTQLGFYDVAIAAPSQKAALEAWGARQNLFDAGLASVAAHGQVVDAALSKPGVLFRRPLGSGKPYVEATDGHADLPNIGKAHFANAKPRPKGPPKLTVVPKGPTPAERAEEKRAAAEHVKAARESLKRAEEAERKAAQRAAQEELKRAEAEHAATLRTIAREIEALKRREQEEKKAFAAKKRALLAEAKEH